LKLKAPAAIADEIVAAAKPGLHPTDPELWTSRAGLVYGPDDHFGSRILHVMNHALDDATRPSDHGVFDDGVRGTLAVVDEAWLKVLAQGSDVRPLSVRNGVKTWEVNMEHRIGFVGGKSLAYLT